MSLTVTTRSRSLPHGHNMLTYAWARIRSLFERPTWEDFVGLDPWGSVGLIAARPRVNGHLSQRVGEAPAEGATEDRREGDPR